MSSTTVQGETQERIISESASVDGLPRESYVSPTIFDREVERLLKPSWMLAGHVSDLAKPGDFITFNWREESALILRAKNGEVVAHHNFCRHRGFRLREEEKGRIRSSILCGYHGWCFEQTGELRSATRMGGEQLDRNEWGLKPVALECWNGLIFVSFAPQRPEPLATQMAGLDLSQYDLGRAKVAFRKYREFDANWKVVADNVNECYHCTLNHPELAKAFDVHALDSAGDIRVVDNGYLVNGIPILGASFTKSGEAACRVPLGHPGPPPANSVMLGMFPGLLVFCYPDYVSILNIRPLSHSRTALENIFLVNAAAVEGEDYGVEELCEMQLLATEQDGPLIARAWAGMQSSAFEFGPFHPAYEPTLAEFSSWYRRQMSE